MWGGVQCGECDSASEILVNVDMCIYLSIGVFVSLSLSLSVCVSILVYYHKYKLKQTTSTVQQDSGQHDATSAQIRRRFRVDYTDALSSLVYYHKYKLKQTTSKEINGTTV